tara:strand:+ start:1516 stop:1725 length:210 start_codon:yes stop_codon:yes gene_type:complete
MWIPVIVIAWSLNGVPTWVNFPMVNFPFSAYENCLEYTTRIKDNVKQNKAYVNGFATCIQAPITLGENT